MQNQTEIIKSKINIISLIWFILIAELVILFVVFYFILASEDMIQSKDTVDIAFLYISYIIAIAAVPAVSKVYDVFKKKSIKETELLKKLETYKLAFIIKAGVFEFSAVLLLVAFYLNEIYEPLYMFVIIIIAFLFNKPSIKRFQKDFLNDIDDNVIEEMEETNIKTKF